MRTRMLTGSLFPLALLVLGVRAPGVGAQQTVDLSALLQQTGLKYSAVPKTENAWKVPYDDGKGGTIDEYITYSNAKDDFALIFVTVVDRPPHYVFSTALLTRAMELNNDEVGVKFVLDDEYGDIDCQREVYLPTATAASLKMEMNLVAREAEDEWKELNGM